VPFRLLAWTGVDETASERGAHDVPFDGIPADIPSLGDERVVLLRPLEAAHAVTVSPSFDALEPSVTVVAELASEEVVRSFVKLGIAVGRASASIPELTPRRRR
jgi:hypothetical protein